MRLLKTNTQLLSILNLIAIVIAFSFLYTSKGFLSELGWTAYLIYMSPFALFSMTLFFSNNEVIKKIALVLICLISLGALILLLEASDVLGFSGLLIVGGIPLALAILYFTKRKPILLFLMNLFILIFNLLLIIQYMYA